MLDMMIPHLLRRFSRSVAIQLCIHAMLSIRVFMRYKILETRVISPLPNTSWFRYPLVVVYNLDPCYSRRRLSLKPFNLFNVE